MKVNSESTNLNFSGLYNSTILKKGLEFAADNGALFAATTTLALSGGIRTASIFAAPNTNKENKKVASAKSITSALLEFLITLTLSIPLVKGIKKIEKNPTKYLNPKSLENLKDGTESLKDSKAYSFASQTLKLGLGMAVAIPKSILTVMGMPYILDSIFSKKQNNDTKKDQNGLIFKGKNDNLANGLSKIFNNDKLQEFSKKYKDTNFPMHITAIKDIIATGVTIHCFNKNKNIDESRKSAISANSLIATGLSIISSYIIDKALDKPTQKFVKQFKEKNSNDPKLSKYLEGIKIAKPILIMGFVYYTIIPLFATYLADRVASSPKFTNTIKKV